MRAGVQAQAAPIQSLNLEGPLGTWVYSTSLLDSILYFKNFHLKPKNKNIEASGEQ